MNPPIQTAKTAIIISSASIAMDFPLGDVIQRKFFGDQFIENDEDCQGDTPLEEHGPHRAFGENVEPIVGIGPVAVQKPPDQHGDELEGKEDGDQIIESFPHFDLLAGAGDDFFPEFSRPDFKNEKDEEGSADHQSQSPDPVLIVEKSHADGRGKSEDKAGDPDDGDSFFAGQSRVHENASDEFQLRDQ